MPTSISGVPLAGNRLLRMTYLDEAGISSREPIAVVAAIMIDVDGHLPPLQADMEAIIEKLAPEFENFYFHATDIWNGNGIFEGRKEWPFERRIELLNALAEIPAKYELPISIGMFVKSNADDRLNSLPAEKQKIFHAIAFAECCMGVEEIMRKALSDEITIIVAENCPHIRKDLKDMMIILKSQELIEEYRLGEYKMLPFKHIKDETYFSDKSALCLQLADFCAFTVRAYYAGSTYRRDCLEALYKKIEPQIYQRFLNGVISNKTIIIKDKSRPT